MRWVALASRPPGGHRYLFDSVLPCSNEHDLKQRRMRHAPQAWRTRGVAREPTEQSRTSNPQPEPVLRQMHQREGIYILRMIYERSQLRSGACCVRPGVPATGTRLSSGPHRPIQSSLHQFFFSRFLPCLNSGSLPLPSRPPRKRTAVAAVAVCEDWNEGWRPLNPSAIPASFSRAQVRKHFL